MPFLIYLYVIDITTVNKWKAWGILTMLLSFPSGKPMTSEFPWDKPGVTTTSTPDPSRMELPKLQRRAFPYRVSGLV